jgi:hypothetical protein
VDAVSSLGSNDLPETRVVGSSRSLVVVDRCDTDDLLYRNELHSRIVAEALVRP